MKRITISDVAREVGGSVSTVSRILNDNPNVDPELCRRVRDTITRTGYIPNASAQYIRTGNSRILGMIISNAANQHFGCILDGALDCALEHGYRITVFSSNGNTKKDVQYLHSVAASAANGLIYCPHIGGQLRPSGGGSFQEYAGGDCVPSGDCPRCSTRVH